MAHSHAGPHDHDHTHHSPPLAAMGSGPSFSLFALSAGARLLIVLGALALLWTAILLVILP